MIAAPLLLGAVQRIVTFPAAAVPLTAGLEGTVRGFVLTLADAGDFPAAFTAITRT